MRRFGLWRLARRLSDIWIALALFVLYAVVFTGLFYLFPPRYNDERWVVLTFVGVFSWLFLYIWLASYKDNKRLRRSRDGRCRRCGYDLRGCTADDERVRCPECGCEQLRPGPVSRLR